jgi:Ca-activated chloride channel family protein
MLATYSHLRSLLAAPKPQFGLRFALLSALLSVNPAFSQAPSAPAQAVPAQTQSAAEFNKPLQRETQPDLAVDRDPIPSPDVVVPTTASTNAPSIPGPAGQIQKGQNGVYTLHEDVDEVLLDLTVVDEKGRPVLDLTRSAFRVFEDAVPQATTSYVHQDQPVSMGIMIDNSGSMLDKRGAVNAAALKLLTESNPKDAAFVVNFNERAYLDQGFTVDRVALNRGLSHFDSRGTTALYDAVAASADELAHHAKQRKQVLLIVTDGADNASRLNLRDAIRRVQGLAGPVVYTIGLLYDSDRNEFQKAHDDLESLSAETGGVAYFPRSLDEVSEIASEVARDIRNQYGVGYHSSKPASLGGYREIHVEAYAPGYKHLIVRTRRGYYAQTGQKKTTGDASSMSDPPTQQ